MKPCDFPPGCKIFNMFFQIHVKWLNGFAWLHELASGKSVIVQDRTVEQRYQCVLAPMATPVSDHTENDSRSGRQALPLTCREQSSLLAKNAWLSHEHLQTYLFSLLSQVCSVMWTWPVTLQQTSRSVARTFARLSCDWMLTKRDPSQGYRQIDPLSHWKTSWHESIEQS